MSEKTDEISVSKTSCKMVDVYRKWLRLDPWSYELTRGMDKDEAREGLEKDSEMFDKGNKLFQDIITFIKKEGEYKELLKDIKKMRSASEIIGYMEGKLQIMRERIEGMEEELSKTITQKDKLIRGLLQKKLEGFRKQYSLKFGDGKEHLMDALVENKGYCSSKPEGSDNFCPCEDVLKELIKNGRCKGGMFVMEKKGL